MSISRRIRSWFNWIESRRKWRRTRREMAERAARRAAWLVTTGALRKHA